MQKFLQLFGRLKSVVLGMVHVRALPGTPCVTLPLAQIIEAACREAEMYRAAGVDGLIVENMHDRPYTFDVGVEVTAAMAVICTSVKQACPTLPIGVQILSAANQEALAVALASGADFVRVEGFVFSHVADEGILNACAGNLLRYRKQIGAEHIQVFADIKKKHSAHALTADVTVAETAKAAEFFLADGVVLTGTATGSEADPKELEGFYGKGQTAENSKWLFLHRFLEIWPKHVCTPRLRPAKHVRKSTTIHVQFYLHSKPNRNVDHFEVNFPARVRQINFWFKL